MRLTYGIFVLVLYALGPRAEAQRREVQAGDALLRRGAAALAAGDRADAYRLLLSAYRLAPGPRPLYQLAQLALSEDRLVDAHDLLRRYLQEAGPEEGEEEPRLAQRALARARPPCGEVVVVGERGALVFVENRLVGALPLPRPLLVPVGRHRVAVEADGQRVQGAVTVLEGRTAEMRFNQGSGAVLVTLPPPVIVLDRSRDLPADLGERLGRVAERELRRALLAPFDRDVALGRARDLVDCLDEARCRDEIATRSEVDYVLVSRVDAGAGQLSAQLYDAPTGELAASRDGSCAGCAPEQLAEGLGPLLREVLAAGLKRTRGAIEVTSEPPGAEVKIGDQPVGRTPYRRAAFTGPREVSLSLLGYHAARKSIVVSERETATIKIELQPEPEPAPAKLAAQDPLATRRRVLRSERAPRPRYRIALGALSLAAGLALTGFGAAAVAIDGRCVVDAVAPALPCRQLFGTLPAGAGLLAGGAALLGAGALLIALPGPLRQVESFVEIRPTGAGIILSGRF